MQRGFHSTLRRPFDWKRVKVSSKSLSSFSFPPFLLPLWWKKTRVEMKERESTHESHPGIGRSSHPAVFPPCSSIFDLACFLACTTALNESSNAFVKYSSSSSTLFSFSATSPSLHKIAIRRCRSGPVRGKGEESISSRAERRTGRARWGARAWVRRRSA